MFFTNLFRFTRCTANSFKTIFKRINNPYIVKICGVSSFAFNFAHCESTPYNFHFDSNSLEHEFLINQACTANVGASSQLLTVVTVAYINTNQRIRELVSKEIALIRQSLEWGESATPEEHWECLIDVRGQVADLNYNLGVFKSYLEYAERLATTSAELSYLSGNTAASDVICEHLASAQRLRETEAAATELLQKESLAIQKTAVAASAQMKELLESEDDSQRQVLKQKQNMQQDKS